MPSVRSHNNPELINKMAPVVCITKSRLLISQPYRKSIRIGFPNSFTGSQLIVRQQTLIQFLTRLIDINVLANKKQLLPTVAKLDRMSTSISSGHSASGTDAHQRPAQPCCMVPPACDQLPTQFGLVARQKKPLERSKVPLCQSSRCR